MRASARERTPLFYASCPHCGDTLKQPFNRLGGPQLSDHVCTGRRRRYFLIAASGEGYISYPFDAGERWEPVFARWIEHWQTDLRETLTLRFSV